MGCPTTEDTEGSERKKWRAEWKAMTPEERRARVTTNREIMAKGKARVRAMMEAQGIELGEPALSRAKAECANLEEWDALSDEEKANRISHYRAITEAERQERNAAIERAIETGEI